jgi:hypothetical protein
MSVFELNIEREVYHILPVNDLKRHSEQGCRCWCEPSIEQYDNGNCMVVHNSADGREFFERERLGH